MEDDASHRNALRARYDAIWDEGWPAVRAGAVDCDTHLTRGADPRRGVSLIARPGLALLAGFADVQARLAAIGPGQYLHPAHDLHLTVLSLFTVTPDYAARLDRLPDYRAAVHAALKDTPPFAIDFTGITVSRGAVLARGYPRDGTLEAVRERLREGLRARGLDGTLDQRYRLVTAHTTLLRFVRPLAHPAPFADALAGLRDAPLGTLHADRLELVVNDWYMTLEALRLVETLPLDHPRSTRECQ